MTLTTIYSNNTLFTIYAALSLPNDTLALMMEISFTEQYSNACDGNTECICAVGFFMNIFLNEKLAIAAIEAPATDNKQPITRHILEIQK